MPCRRNTPSHGNVLVVLTTLFLVIAAVVATTKCRLVAAATGGGGGGGLAPFSYRPGVSHLFNGRHYLNPPSSSSSSSSSDHHRHYHGRNKRQLFLLLGRGGRVDDDDDDDDEKNDNDKDTNQDPTETTTSHHATKTTSSSTTTIISDFKRTISWPLPRGGGGGSSMGGGGSFRSNNSNNNKMHLPVEGLQTVATILQTTMQVLLACGNAVLPPTVAIVSAVVQFYRALPKDLVLAQVGLVHCFAGGYYPTLFSSLAAAQEYGWNAACQAVADLTNEALVVLRALEEHEQEDAAKQGYGAYFASSSSSSSDTTPAQAAQRLAKGFSHKTSIVLATVDPEKINQAAGSLYTTWLGVQSVLRLEYARTITLSLNLARYLEKVAQFVFKPVGRWLIEEKYHQWIPVVIGWACKAAAMNVAWRAQRVMTAATSAVTGGLLFARATGRLLFGRRRRRKQEQQKEEAQEDSDNDDDDDDDVTFDHTSSMLDEFVGFAVAALGFYTQFESQWRSGFSFQVPFPLSLVTWPFDWAEKWIQWQITKE